MTREELIERLMPIAIELQREKVDKQLLAAHIVLCTLLGALTDPVDDRILLALAFQAGTICVQVLDREDALDKAKEN